LNQSYHPRYNYEGDIQGMGDEVVVLVGEYDEAVDPEALQIVFKDAGSNAEVHVLPDTNHFGIFSDQKAHQVIVDSLD
jgi:uncharacterized protein YndB with AHSA1/START domain